MLASIAKNEAIQAIAKIRTAKPYIIYAVDDYESLEGGYLSRNGNQDVDNAYRISINGKFLVYFPVEIIRIRLNPIKWA